MNKISQKFNLLILCSIFILIAFVTVLNAAEPSLEAERHMARGLAAMEDAKTQADFQDAIREFKKVIQYAPNWTDAWFNLGVAQESAGDFATAIKSFQTYLEKNPDTSDRKAVQTRIFKLEYKHEKSQKSKSCAKKISC